MQCSRCSQDATVEVSWKGEPFVPVCDDHLAKFENAARAAGHRLLVQPVGTQKQAQEVSALTAEEVALVREILAERASG